MEENKSFQFSTIEEALDDLRAGKIILCTDDPDRENEGDFICAAQFATTENVNFMAVHGKGLICMPMSAEPTTTKPPSPCPSTTSTPQRASRRKSAG